MCGLFGYISKEENTTFNWDKFNFLGVDNDERGGDSIGRLVGDAYIAYVSKGTAKTSYYSYVTNHRNDKKHHLAIGHTRKASVGLANEENAQPVLLQEEGEPLFAMVHNGTLFNYEELAKKYNVPHFGKTDSQVLASIIKEHGFEVLKEYVGAAALIVRDDRIPNTFWVFKGASLTYRDKVQEERPLYYYQETEDSMYISSKQEGLYFIGGDADTVIDFDVNTLYRICEGRIIDKISYDRNKMKQIKSHISTNSNCINYSDYDGYDSYGRNSYNTWSNKQNNNTSVRSKPTLWKNDRIEFVKDTLQMLKLRYYLNGKIATGIFNVGISGKVNYQKKIAGEVTLYIYAGVLLKDKESFYNVKKLLGKPKAFNDCFKNTKILADYSVYPIGTLEHSYGDISSSSAFPYFTGKIRPLFCNKTYDVSRGDLISIDISTIFNSDLSMFKQSTDDTIDYESDDEVPFDIEMSEDIDPLLEKEIKDMHSVLLLAIDASKSNLEITGFESDCIDIIGANLNAIEDVLYDEDAFRTKKLIVKYE